MATFLELLSSNFVIKYYFGPIFDFWSQLSNSLPPAGGGGLGGVLGVNFSTCFGVRELWLHF